jgi:hypothetical protein
MISKALTPLAFTLLGKGLVTLGAFYPLALMALR